MYDKAINQPGNLFDWYPFYVASKLDHSKLSTALNQAARLVTSVDGLPAHSLFNVRLWAMKCLIVCNMLDPATFWNQATKCAKVFAKDVEAKDDPGSILRRAYSTHVADILRPTASDVANAKQISGFFDTLVQVAKDTPNVKEPSKSTASTMLRGSGFAAACEYWTRFARFVSWHLVVHHLLLTSIAHSSMTSNS